MSRQPRVLSCIVAIACLGVEPAVLAQQAPPFSQTRDQGRTQPRPMPDWMQQQAPQRGNDDYRDGSQSRRDSASDAVRRVERDTRAEVLSVERVQYDGRDMHRVKVVDDHGRVRVYMQDSSGGGNRRPSNSQNNDNDND